MFELIFSFEFAFFRLGLPYSFINKLLMAYDVELQVQHGVIKQSTILMAADI